MNKKVLLVALTVVSVSITVASARSPRILAHRGGRAEQEENTLEAFKATYKAGCHGFETDVHMTRDGELVIMHDFDLARMTDGEGFIEESTGEYIRSLRTKKGNRVPFLGDLLSFFSTCSNMYVEFEMKTNEKFYPDDVLRVYCDKVWDEISSSQPEDALYIFSSFDVRPLKYIKEKHPEAEVMLITSSPCNKEMVEKCQALGIHRLAATLGGTCRDGVKLAHENGIILNLWPGYAPQDTHLAALLGADYICTDIPAEVMRYIKKNKLDINSDGCIKKAVEKK